ncbi:MAG: cytidine deaminase [Nevskia sp.]
MNLTESALAELPENRRTLLAAAVEATKTAYAPYSRFRVGAALLFGDGTMQRGSNFENVSYGLSLCAETVAIASANAAGRLRDIVAIAVAAHGELEAAAISAFIAPCGRCRQILAETAGVCGHDIEVLLLSRDGLRVRCTTAGALLPLAFGG